MKFKQNYLQIFFAGLLVIGGVFVAMFYVDDQPKVLLSIRKSDSLNELILTSITTLVNGPSGNRSENNSIFILGVDSYYGDASPFVHATQEAFLGFGRPFQATAVEDRIFYLMPAQGTDNIEHFDFYKNPERLVAGIKSAIEKNVSLLVVVQNADALRARTQGLLATIEKTLSQELDKEIFFPTLILSSFPLKRENESLQTLQCNTGEEDRENVAVLGCYLLQKSRRWYSKHWPPNSWLFELDKVQSGEGLLVLQRVE